MDLGLGGKAAVVTGASEGIGKAAAQSLAREGVSVVICARRPDVLEQAARELGEITGGQVVPVAADVSRAEDVQRVIQTAVERFGRLDILVNNAGTSRSGPFFDATDAAWQDDLDLKLFGAIRGCRLAIPHLRQVGGGSIINILNTGAKTPGARSLPTSVSRAAGLALTKALSKEFAADNVRVNAVLIGYVRSGQQRTDWERNANAGETAEAYFDRQSRERGIPLGRIGAAEDVGDLIAFLCSNRATYLTGTSLAFDGGSSAVI